MKKMKIRLQTKIIILSTLFSVIVILILGIYSLMTITSVLERKIGENALSIAKTIALMPEIKEAFNTERPEMIIQPLAEAIRIEIGAEFIVIGNKEGIRYSHPYPDRLGKEMVGGDNEGVLQEGKSYVSKAVGTLGPSLRGKTPIFDETNQIIGVVSVGILLEDIEEREQAQTLKILGIVLIVLLIGIGGSYYLSWNIKKDIFGLEPEEISQLFLERQTILESVREGIIAVNSEGKITLINETAKKMLAENEHEYDDKNVNAGKIGRPIEKVLPNTKIIEVLSSGTAQFDQEMLIGSEWVITNRIPMIVKDHVIGAVASFRKKTEIDQLLHELSDHKLYSDTLRAQNHEFTNKLYTISGLLQLEKYQEAIQFIAEETIQQDDMIEFLMDNISDPKLTAFIVGQISRSKEQKVKLIIDPSTKLKDEISINIDDLITIYGNLIENSLESVRQQTDDNRKINVLIRRMENWLVFRIEDWGNGIPEEHREKIFEDGFTTKGERRKRGLGLALVASMILKYKGEITIAEPDHQGVVFEVRLPCIMFERG